MSIRHAWLGVLVCGGCLFSGTRSAKQHENENATSRARNQAIANKDYLAALGYDDLFLQRGFDDAHVREDRKRHFALLLETELAKLGPISETTIEAVFSKLVAFRDEARRSQNEGYTPDYVKAQLAQRREDLALVDAQVIAPRFADVAKVMWTRADAMVARGELFKAIQLGDLIVAYVPPGGDDAAHVARLRQQAAQIHLALATEAGDALPGARVFHAKIAALFGAKPGALAEPSPALLAATSPNWTITSPGTCGHSSSPIEAQAKSLEDRLRHEGFAAGPGEPIHVTVTFDSCPITAREWDDTEEIPYTEKQKISVKVPRLTYNCANIPDKVVERRTIGNREYVTTEGHACAGVDMGAYEMVEKEVDVDKVERVATHHKVQKLAAHGTVRVEIAGAQKAAPFSLETESSDDVSWTAPAHRGSSLKGNLRAHGLTEAQVRGRLYETVRGTIDGLASPFFKARLDAEIAKAQAAAAAGKRLEADDAFFIARRIGSLGGAQVASFVAWDETTYHLPQAALAAAFSGEPFPEIHPVEAKLVIPAFSFTNEGVRDAALDDRELASILTLTGGAGPTFTSTTGGTSTDHGGIAGISVMVFPESSHFGGGMRFTGGFGSGHGVMDVNFLGGVGAHIGWLSVDAITGIGIDFASGNMEGIGTTPDDYRLPVGGYWEYGARVAYPFALPGTKLELMYTKAFRTASKNPVEKRGDIRLIVKNIALDLRYDEFLSDGDGFLGVFGSDHRSAKAYMLLIGGGI